MPALEVWADWCSYGPEQRLLDWIYAPLAPPGEILQNSNRSGIIICDKSRDSSLRLVVWPAVLFTQFCHTHHCAPGWIIDDVDFAHIPLMEKKNLSLAVRGSLWVFIFVLMQPTHDDLFIYIYANHATAITSKAHPGGTVNILCQETLILYIFTKKNTFASVPIEELYRKGAKLAIIVLLFPLMERTFYWRVCWYTNQSSCDGGVCIRGNK